MRLRANWLLAEQHHQVLDEDDVDVVDVLLADDDAMRTSVSLGYRI